MIAIYPTHQCAVCLFRVGFGNKIVQRITGIPKTNLVRFKMELGIPNSTKKRISLHRIITKGEIKAKQSSTIRKDDHPSLFEFRDGQFTPSVITQKEDGQYEFFSQEEIPTQQQAKVDCSVEVWRKIEGSDNYSVSNLARIRNNSTGRILKSRLVGAYLMGYYQNVAGKQERKLLHRIVASAFIPNESNHLVVNHIDGNKLNAKADNLEWCTHKQNSEHYQKILRDPSRRHPQGRVR